MTPKQFQQELNRLETEFKNFFEHAAPTIAGNVAVSLFKENFQNESFFGEKWKEVKRRNAPKLGKRGKELKQQPAAVTRKILTGVTGDLGRSIQVKPETPNSKTIIWTNPSQFYSKEPYGRVHNEGLRAGRGTGFIMPRRQFIGSAPELNKAIIEALSRKLNNITQNPKF
jgi:phage gpG-like protein